MGVPLRVAMFQAPLSLRPPRKRCFRQAQPSFPAVAAYSTLHSANAFLLKPQLQLIIHPGLLFRDMKLVSRKAATNQKGRCRVVELLIFFNLDQTVICIAVFAVVTAGVVGTDISGKVAGTFFS